MSRHLRRIERMDTGRKNRVVPESAWPGALGKLKWTVDPNVITAGFENLRTLMTFAPEPDPRLEPLRRLGADIDQRLDHARMLEAAGVSDELVTWIVKLAATAQITGQDLQQLAYHGIRLNIRAITDTDHAAALEREAVAVWLERNILGAMPLDLIAAIRNGDHHAKESK